MKINKKDIKAHSISDLSVSVKLIEQKDINIGSEGAKLEPEDNDSQKKSPKYRKLKELHLEFLKRYLNENIYINNTEARNRLCQDTGIEVTIPAIRSVMNRIREENDSEHSKLDINISKIKHKGSKLKGIHIECLKNYLKEDIYISNVKAKNRLCKETGIEISISTIRIAMNILREGNGLNSSKLNRFTPGSEYKSRKLKDVNIEHLKKCILENKSMTAEEARKILQKETGLMLSERDTNKIFNKAHELVYPNHLELSSSTSRKRNNGKKLLDHHKEYLKKCLVDNKSIMIEEAKLSLEAETGLVISYSSIQKALKNIREEISSQDLKLDPSTTPINHKGYKLKNLHIECLKNYLIENKSITAAEASKRLQVETGLVITNDPVQKVLKKIKNKIYPDYHNLDTSISGIKYKGKKLKDNHIDYLEKYLIENRFITAPEANQKLQEETGLEISNRTVQLAFNRIKEKIYPDYNKLNVSKSGIEHKGSKLKSNHIECLERYLTENRSIGPTEARTKLQEETGLDVSFSCIYDVLKKIRKINDSD